MSPLVGDPPNTKFWSGEKYKYSTPQTGGLLLLVQLPPGKVSTPAPPLKVYLTPVSFVVKGFEPLVPM